MSWKALPHIAEAQSVQERDGKFDKIDLIISGWQAFCSDATIEEMVHHLQEMLLPSHRAGAAPSPWYNAVQGRPFGRRRLSFRGAGPGGYRQSGMPLFSGILFFDPDRSAGEFEATRLSIRAQLSLNPTRYLRHRRRPTRMQLLQSPDTWDLAASDVDLVSGDWAHAPPAEVSLDNNDNVLLGAIAHRQGHPSVWMRNVREYFEAVIGLIDSHIREASDICDVDFRFFPNYNLRSVESYWEFQSGCAVSSVQSMENVLAAAGRRFSVGRHSSTDVLRSLDMESHSYRVHFNQSKSLSIYAKTKNRIRMEMDYRFSDDASAIGGRHTTSDLEDVFDWLERARSEASRDLNSVLPHLCDATCVIEDAPSAFQLVSVCSQYAPNFAIFNLLLRKLVLDGRVLTSLHPNWSAYINRLVQEDVLFQPRSGIRGFTVTPRFAPALSALRERPGQDQRELRERSADSQE